MTNVECTPLFTNVGYISITVYALLLRSYHVVQSSPLGAFESLKLSSDLPDRFFQELFLC
jgi:hypothetical protein